MQMQIQIIIIYLSRNLFPIRFINTEKFVYICMTKLLHHFLYTRQNIFDMPKLADTVAFTYAYNYGT